MKERAVIDQIFLALRWDGFYQKSRSVIFLLALANQALHAVSVVFIGKSVDHQCRILQNLNITTDDVSYNIMSNNSGVFYNLSYGQCHIDIKNGSDVMYTTPCRGGYEYAESVKSSFVAEWDLVCDRESFSDLSQTVLVGGEIFGGLFLTRLADKHGRKISFMATSLMTFAATVLCSWSPNFIVFLVFKFIIGASIASSYQLGYIQMIEMMPTSHRALPEKLNSFLWTVYLLLLCLIAYLTRNLSWQYTQLILSMVSVYTLFLWWITDESIRWLCAVKRYTEVETLIEKIASINKVNPREALDLFRKLRFSDTELETNETLSDIVKSSETLATLDKGGDGNPDKKLSIFLKNRNLLKVTLISTYLWFVDALAYDGLLMISPGLHDDFYLGFVLAVVTEFPATIIFCLLINRIGRKKCTAIFHPLAGIFLIVSMVLLHTPLSDFIPGHYWMSLVLSLLGRLNVCAGFSTTLTYIPELFPTSLRNTGYGIAGVGLYTAGTISPFTRTLSRHIPWVPSLVFGVMCITVPIVITFLPETQGQELAQTIDDMSKGKKKDQENNELNKE